MYITKNFHLFFLFYLKYICKMQSCRMKVFKKKVWQTDLHTYLKTVKVIHRGAPLLKNCLVPPNGVTKYNFGVNFTKINKVEIKINSFQWVLAQK